MIMPVVHLVSHVDLGRYVSVKIVPQRYHPIYAQDVVIPMVGRIGWMVHGFVGDVEMRESGIHEDQ